MKRFAALLAALPLAACISFADAGSLVDVGVVDRTSGQKLRVYRHDGRLYVAGTPGNRYAVVLRNRTGGRLLTIVSVDGLNVLNGQTASTDQSGYVLHPGQEAGISGWRKSMDEVAAFYFTALPDSYAARTDRPQNVGVIGVAVYREAAPVVPPPVGLSTREEKSTASADGAAANEAGTPAASAGQARAPAPAVADQAAARKSESRLGTGHGERVSAPTQFTDFRRASETPAEVIKIYYDSYARLVAQGIIPRAKPQPVPEPFPGGFAPDPRS